MYFTPIHFSRGEIDFQFRLFTEEDKLVLEDVRCDDTAEDDINSVIVNSEVARVDLKKGIELIQNRFFFLVINLNITNILKYDLEGLDETEMKRQY